MQTDVKVGLGTKAGIVVSLLTLLPPLVTEVVALFENTAAQWTSAEKTSLVAGAAVALVTILSRAAQAVAKVLKGQ